jgi:hypothetical protein
MEEERKVNKVLVEKLEGKRPLERPRCRWKDEMRMGLGDIGCYELSSSGSPELVIYVNNSL